MQWIELEPSWEYPFHRYYTSMAQLIDGRHYYSYVALDEDDGRYRGWVMSVPGHRVETYIDEPTKEDVQKHFQWFIKSIGG